MILLGLSVPICGYAAQCFRHFFDTFPVGSVRFADQQRSRNEMASFDNPKSQRLRKFGFALLLIVAAVAFMRPVDQTGLTIALLVFPPFFLVLMAIDVWWIKKLGDDLLFRSINRLILACIGAGVIGVASYLSPDISQHFAW